MSFQESSGGLSGGGLTLFVKLGRILRGKVDGEMGTLGGWEVG